ncbi:hypothetical protein QUF74_13480 [Candidatus Halobeggiatoa sp. HSG11]|nr:hypothetical protein [Candidatus Halobeggiatoa sp. HSG11]
MLGSFASQLLIHIKGNTEFSDDQIQANGSLITSGINSSSSGSGNAGSVNMETGSLTLKNGASINATVYDSGQGGNINIKATDNIEFSGNGVIGQASSIQANTRSKETNAGSGGTINLEAGNIHLNDGALIGSSAIGAGKGGIIAMQANNITLTGTDKRGRNSGISSLAYSSGDGGTITLNAKQLNILNGTTIGADSRSSGQGGNIIINSKGTVKLEGLDNSKYGSLISANTQGRAANAGNGGTIEVSAKTIKLTDGAQIGTSTFGPGNGGTVKVDAERVIFSGTDQTDNAYQSGIFTGSSTVGDAGIIILKANNLTLDTKALVTAKTYGTGKGGNIIIHSDNLRLTGNSLITARSDGSGDAGKVQLTLGNMSIINSELETSALNADGGDLSINSSGYVYLSNSKISTSVSEEFGGGGNITANPEFIVLNSATIFAKAKKGNGGNINVTTTGIYNFDMTPISEVINASSEFGLDGKILINTPDSITEGNLFALSTSFFDSSNMMNTPCNQIVAENSISFINVLSEGVSNEPEDLLSSGIILTDILPVRATVFNKNLPIISW